MALISLDTKSLHLKLTVGVNEEYKPNKEIIKVNDKVEKLKENTNKFIKDNWGEKPASELAEIFKKDEQEKSKWVDYLQNTYNTELKDILTTIDTINEKICPNYGDINGRNK